MKGGPTPLDKFGVKLTQLTQEQADYIGVKVEGPYKPEHYLLIGLPHRR